MMVSSIYEPRLQLFTQRILWSMGGKKAYTWIFGISVGVLNSRDPEDLLFPIHFTDSETTAQEIIMQNQAYISSRRSGKIIDGYSRKRNLLEALQEEVLLILS
ncbi:hypothetical protein CEXT_674551 [Caerostris extrusa]|uniref:Uncharacterized protein n=1 Tax=Caerostris extrusa TaxID=172846 RepID=A0AAV4S905_CAEEX|nr:hypothetical protein CEXT_674551 [Caerostris extrusa]